MAVVDLANSFIAGLELLDPYLGEVKGVGLELITEECARAMARAWLEFRMALPNLDVFNVWVELERFLIVLRREVSEISGHYGTPVTTTTSCASWNLCW